MRESIPLSHMCNKYEAPASSQLALLSILTENRGKATLMFKPYKKQQSTVLWGVTCQKSSWLQEVVRQLEESPGCYWSQPSNSLIQLYNYAFTRLL